MWTIWTTLGSMSVLWERMLVTGDAGVNKGCGEMMAVPHKPSTFLDICRTISSTMKRSSRIGAAFRPPFVADRHLGASRRLPDF